MSSSARAATVLFDQDGTWVGLGNGRMIGVPLVWFPRLLNATPAQREAMRISARGLHWASLDKSLRGGLLTGMRRTACAASTTRWRGGRAP